MIRFFVNGNPASVSRNTQIEFFVENSLFSESKSYTLSVEFPVKGCQENIEAFGHLYRQDVAKSPDLIPCRMSCGTLMLEGALAIIEVNDSSVKAQFLEGVDAANEDDSIDDLMINELDLGSFPHVGASSITPVLARKGTSDEICYPWIAENSDVVNNHAASASQWHEDTKRLSWQPYLLTIMRRVAAAAGYTLYPGVLESSVWSKVVICNSIPGIWYMPEYRSAMPAWSVREFFTKLGIAMDGVFRFDFAGKAIVFSSWQQIREAAGVVRIDAVADKYSATVSRDEKDADFLPLKRFRYKHPDSAIWKYLDCPWISSVNWKLQIIDSVEQFNTVRHTSPLIYCRRIDTYFVARPVIMYSKGHVSDSLSSQYPYARIMEMQPVNVFGPAVWERGMEDYEELDVVPVTVDYAFEGKMMFLPLSSYDDSESGSGMGSDLDGDMSFANGVQIDRNKWLMDKVVISHTRQTAAIESASEDKESPTYYSSLLLGVVDPDTRSYPITDVDVLDGEIRTYVDIFRIRDGGAGETIDPKVMYSFSFIASDLPDINALFEIQGQRYICRKLTARFSVDGMSSLIEGDFYRIVR